MQKPDEEQFLVLPAGEEVPCDEVFRLGPQFPAKAGKHPPGFFVVGGDVLEGVEGGGLPLRRPDRKRDLVLGKALEDAAEEASKLPS